ncbi:Brp/Blh family beta-carotene 15,15'-dioxygenase [Flavobacterium sp. LS2R12]|uniref:Brp/Blh family beta-carotene 15,15'-dioxygenase n=1 Tax=unclassified Flavobacterium TaxID=196869 RepID=UPI003AAD8D5E
MKNYSNIVIVASFFGLWMDSFLSTKIQIMLGFFLIFTFGILHGANDLLLIKNIKATKQSNSWFKILGYYVVVVLIGALLFYIIPQLALLLFILISAYHFGEQQWQDLLDAFPKWFQMVFQFLYGFIILQLLFVFHSSEVQSIILKIANIKIPSLYFDLLLQISSATFIGLSAYLYWKLEKIRRKLLLEFFYLVLFAILFKSSSLIWGFAIYFVLWHSIPSIIDQIKFLNGSFSIKYFIAYCKTAGIYWLLSIVGITLIYYMCKEEQLFNALFFSFLAAITFPHALVITNMFGTKQTKK